MSKRIALVAGLLLACSATAYAEKPPGTPGATPAVPATPGGPNAGGSPATPPRRPTRAAGGARPQPSRRRPPSPVAAERPPRRRSRRPQRLDTRCWRPRPAFHPRQRAHLRHVGAERARGSVGLRRAPRYRQRSDGELVGRGADLRADQVRAQRDRAVHRPRAGSAGGVHRSGHLTLHRVRA